MAIEGNLETMSLAELLQWLANGRQTGTLIVDNGSVEKKIYLREGRVLSSSSSDPRGFLGHFLVSKGVISEEDADPAVRPCYSYRVLLECLARKCAAVN